MTRMDFMTEEEYALLRDLIHNEFGVLLKGDKRLTVHAKVSHRLRILGLSSYMDYYNYIVSDASKEELFVLASHITNNETYFFREKVQLETFSDILKDIKREKLRKKENTLKILSLACSSGEEPYTLNILVQESGLFLWDYNIAITGIDIDRTALRKAATACYSKNSFRMLNGNRDIIEKYFITDGEQHTLRKPFTRNVEFRHGNILDDDFFKNFNGIDVVFCRNVLIYMSDHAIGKIIKNLHGCLLDSGYLFIGSSESLIQKTNLFMPQYNSRAIVYRKNA